MGVIHSPERRTASRDSDTSGKSAVQRQARVLRMLNCLQSGPNFNAAELAERLKVSRRTVYRDLKMIRDAGVPVHFDAEHSAYRLSREFSRRHRAASLVQPRFGDAGVSRQLLSAPGAARCTALATGVDQQSAWLLRQLDSAADRASASDVRVPRRSAANPQSTSGPRFTNSGRDQPPEAGSVAARRRPAMGINSPYIGSF